MISGTADGHYLRRHSDHVRRRRAVATGNPLEQKGCCCTRSKRPEPGENEITRDVAPIPDGIKFSFVFTK